MPRRNTKRPDHVRAALAVAPALAGAAGFVDAVGFITLRGLFVAHMSGNSVRLGVDLGRGAVGAAAPAAVAVLSFVAGVAVGTVAAEVATRHAAASVAALVLAIETGLVAAFMAYGLATLHGGDVARRSLTPFYVLATLAVVAMGIQTAALRQLGGRTISTTYVTGVLTALTQEATNYVFWLRDGPRRDERRSFLGRVLGLGSRTDSRNRVLLLAAVWLAYAGGAILGGFCDEQVALWSLFVPLGVLLAVIVLDLRRPLDL